VYFIPLLVFLLVVSFALTLEGIDGIVASDLEGRKLRLGDS
jgi:hypothetical protein